MHKFLQIAWHTYWQNFVRRSFLFLAFGLPFLCVLLFGVAAFFSVPLQADYRSIGYVDRAGVLSNHHKEDAGAVRAFKDEAQARHALELGQIQAYYVIAPDYVRSGQVKEVSASLVASPPRARFRQFLRANLLKNTSLANQQRIVQGTSLVRRTLGDVDDAIGRPLQIISLGGMLLLFYALGGLTRSYLWHALSEEHANRTIEIVLSSVAAEQLIAGKVIGLVALGLTPLLVWGSVLGVLLGLLFTLLRGLGLDLSNWSAWNALALASAILLPAYIIEATSTVVIGALTGALEQEQSLPFLFRLIFAIAWFPLVMAAVFAPDSALAVLLSLIPFTAPFVLLIRMMLTTVPGWQIVLSIALLWLTMIASVPFSARLYRAARLLVGQPRSVRHLLLALKS
jgi:ABC-2 type transport system permease protein